MPIEGWRSLLETKWAGCVILHNLPFGFIEIHEVAVPITEPIILRSSIYELQKSAANWSWYDFKVSSNH